jgi:hypothetical protein
MCAQVLCQATHLYAHARVFDLSYRRRRPTVTTIRISHALLQWNAAAIFEVEFPVGTNVEKSLRHVEIIKGIRLRHVEIIKEIRFNCAAFCLESEHSMLGASRVSLNFHTQMHTQPTHAHTQYHSLTQITNTHIQNHTHAQIHTHTQTKQTYTYTKHTQTLTHPNAYTYMCCKQHTWNLDGFSEESISYLRLRRSCCTCQRCLDATTEMILST